MTGIANAGSTRRERDGARLLKGVEQYRSGGSGETHENQCDDKNSHGIPQQSVALAFYERREWPTQAIHCRALVAYPESRRLSDC